MSKNTVTIESPVALGNGQLERITNMMKKVIDEDFVVKNTVNKDMLGGIRIRFGTKMIDLSLEDMIKKIEQELNE